uniref:Uncharacterized protein n=1 Tax=Arundo donax TaxID=35708 RepID=A0A0A9AW84_ARUDO
MRRAGEEGDLLCQWRGHHSRRALQLLQEEGGEPHRCDANLLGEPRESL